MKRYFDAIIIVTLEEEFDNVVSLFEFTDDLSTDNQIMFAVAIQSKPITILLAKQNGMGRTETQQSLLYCLEQFDAGMLICVGIAGGLSSDVAIGDVCYTGSVIDVLDNAKTSDTDTTKQELALSPTIYASPRGVGIAISLNRLNANAKSNHEAWASDSEANARQLLPGSFQGKAGKTEHITRPVAREGSLACGLVSASLEYNRKLRAVDRKLLAVETESGALFSIARQKRLPALTVREISDYAGSDKAKFEEETKNLARKIAVDNAASFLRLQLSSANIIAYFDRRRIARTNDESQLPLIPPPKSDDELFDILITQSYTFNNKLRDLAPGHSLHAKGYRLPVPRIRIADNRLTELAS